MNPIDIFEAVFKVLRVFSIQKQPSTGALLNSFLENFEKKTLRKNLNWCFFRKISAEGTLSKFLEHARAAGVALYRRQTSERKYLQNEG